MNRLFYVLFLIVVLIACNNTNDAANTPTADVQNVQQVEPPSPADEAIAKNAAIKQLDALERLFDNQNYLMANGKDSSYIYFSRLGKYKLFTHSYKMIKGDSANVIIDTIQISAHNKIQWHWAGKKLYLNNTTDFASSWLIEDNKIDIIDFQKIDNYTIKIAHNKQSVILKRTPTISLFLVRSYYDYLHGTHLAFDSTNFTKKHK